MSKVVVTMAESKAKQLLKLFMDELYKTEKVCDEMRRSVVTLLRHIPPEAKLASGSSCSLLLAIECILLNLLDLC